MSNNKGVGVSDIVVETPDYVAEHLYSLVSRKGFKNILDCACGDGILSKNFRKKKGVSIVGLDVIDTYRDNFDTYIHKDFLNTTILDFKDLNIDVIVCNPPFQERKPDKNNGSRRELYPQLFLEHIFKLFGNTMPVIIFVGSWFLSNSNNRMAWLNKNNLTKNITLHKKIFDPVSVESNCLFFNIRQKEAIGFLEYKKPDKKKIAKTKTVALTKEQVLFIEKNIPNFSGEVKRLISQKFPNFP